jgi:hypothetical protein
MPIYLATDTTHNYQIPNAKPSPILENLTGADACVTTLTIPFSSEFLIRKHVETGAILIQQKNGMDLVNSARENRLTSQLSRMYEAGAKYAWQRILLFVGEVTLQNGHAIMDGVDIGTWWQWQGVLDSFRHSRGGSFVTLPHLSLVPEWLTRLEQNLPEWKSHPVKEVFPSVTMPEEVSDNPLQLPRRVSDWRKILVAACPGIGPQKATDLRNAMLEFGADDTFLQALAWATDNSGGMPRVKGWGTQTKEQLRRAIGMGENTTCQLSTYWTNSIQNESE